MALGDDYIDVEDLKNRLGIADGDDDAIRLPGAVSAATQGINLFCGRQFNDAGTASTRVYRARSHEVISVDDFSTATGLVVRVDVDNDGVYETTLAEGEYQCEPLNGVVNGEPGWPFWKLRAVGSQCWPTRKRASVEVTARWGWAAVPVNVVEACRVAAEELFKLRDTPFGIGGYGDFGIVRARDNPFVARMCGKFQRDAVLMA